ncbi:DUF4595 domain-containing protein [Porphyromonas bennonis]|uniref:DUF4595 domain-containing protein n=1 Tax=Porphyromonas bennonis TaxID=501496 RepID=UPI000381238F|nr:DUF4595 domain-containing protein [Porphyromonas bennonis]
MTSSKKYLYTVALALLGAVAFPSCNCNGGEDQPTPPPAEERALVSSLTVTVEDLINSSKKDMTTQYAYGKEGRVSSMTVSITGDDGPHSETWPIIYGDGTMTVSFPSELQVFQTNASGYIIGEKTSGAESFFSASYDTEGHLQSLRHEEQGVYTFRWEGDLISERQLSIAESQDMTSHTTFTYSKTKDPAGLMVLYIPEFTDIPLPGMWFGKAPAYLPSKRVSTLKMPVSNLPVEMTTTFDYTLDAKGRPVKIVTTENLQSKSKDFIPDFAGKILRTTFEITYK